MKNVRGFLIAYFFYMDGVLTVIHFATIYSTDYLKFSVTEAMGMLALVQVTALAGSLAMAKPTDRMGPKWTVSVVLLWWIGTVVAAYFCRTKAPFFVIAALAGLGLGSIQAASRAFMSKLIPKGREAEMFGFYGLCGKSGAILGPVIFGFIYDLADPPTAIVSVAAFYLLGLGLLRPVKDAV
jgi:UMF1 family MFS transporter